MPIGIIINGLSVIIGGLVGAVVGGKLSDEFKEKLNMVFGVCSMSMGISTIILMKNMPAVVFAMIIGTVIGLCFKLGQRINSGAMVLEKGVAQFVKSKKSSLSKDEFSSTLLTVIVLFCASGTGIYGSIISGMTGDHSILIAKSILDLFTAIIFACSIGVVVSSIAIFQVIIFIILFLCAGLIYPLCTPDMINDFKACGGFIMLATGFRMVKLKMFPIADMIPAMVLVMPISYIWTTYIIPLVS